MANLWEKLNTVIRANLNDLVSDNPLKRDRDKPTDTPEKHLERDLPQVQKRMREALQHEDDLQKKIDEFYADIARLDKQADEAVERGDDQAARQFINQLQNTQRQLEFSEAELREHQLLTRQLLQQADALEIAVQETQSAQESKESASDMGETIQDIYDETQRKLNALIERGKQITQAKPVGEIPASQTVDDDLAKRRARLSKPDEST